MNSSRTIPPLRPTLITGFEAFGPWPYNPAEKILNHLAATATPARNLICRVLPVEYTKAGEQLTELICRHDPSIILSIGLSGSRHRICLERFALNIDDVGKPDNSNHVADGEVIDPTGPAALKSSVALPPILAALRAQNIDAEISNHAGTYVCNHVFYQGLRATIQQESQAGCLFVHVPMTRDDLPPELVRDVYWDLHELIRGVELVLAQLERQRDELAGSA